MMITYLYNSNINGLYKTEVFHTLDEAVKLAVSRVVGSEAEAVYEDNGSRIAVRLAEERTEDTPVVFKSFRDLGCILNRQVNLILELKEEGN